ncbi:class I SAM-dependent methyltransferase [Mycetocola zhadangensis]|uniref:Class I SAM-dependent methyltransferase n=1 Tax=Mycetocola zhadangensis TaxID=1164595 RepID=A0A3L7JAV2_9MICO|nr:methyltransferase domain-containing protein [Mycetocola zhadangensis]RLQ85642.1 class I SAM-dependent methyltransferase [Mycetocola zhadangensis]GGE84404.1 SAM-dependent methyltransferase [Mycetocola zhadangensis]
MGIETAVSEHYSSGRLEDVLLSALRDAGIDPDSLQPGDLFPADELHVGGAVAAHELAEAAGISQGHRVLDLGCGIGGPARLFASQFGAEVVGVDVTEEFVHTATSFTRRCGLAELATFVTASALALPFDENNFDRATLLHVGMNIEDKGTLFSEAFRVLKPGGVFAVFDIMRTGEGEVTYPVPWAADAAISFLETPEQYSSRGLAAGFSVEGRRDRRELGIEFLTKMQRAAAQGADAPGPPRLGLPLVLGPDSGRRVGNLLAAVQAGILAPVEILFRKP